MGVGLNCVANFQGMWCRGVIAKMSLDQRFMVAICQFLSKDFLMFDTKINAIFVNSQVFFYDYGTFQTLDSDGKVYFLLRQFSHLPSFAIPCGLYGMKPCSGDEWSSDASAVFNRRTIERVVFASVISMDKHVIILLINTSFKMVWI